MVLSFSKQVLALSLFTVLLDNEELMLLFNSLIIVVWLDGKIAILLSLSSIDGEALTVDGLVVRHYRHVYKKQGEFINAIEILDELCCSMQSLFRWRSTDMRSE